jgi:Lon protease-like protein
VRYGLILYVKQITFRSLKVKVGCAVRIVEMETLTDGWMGEGSQDVIVY